MENIAVIGSGTMGNGIAHVFAQNGFKVNLMTPMAFDELLFMAGFTLGEHIPVLTGFIFFNKPHTGSGQVDAVENVSFAYPSRPDVTVLDGINLTVAQSHT